MTALAETVREFAIPIEPFRDLLTAFKRDQTQTRYDTFDDLCDYCRCSANPVGRLVLFLARCATPDNFAESDAICTGLQLANFWQDVAVDRRKGRVYLPQDEMRRFGVRDADFALESASDGVRRLLAFEVERAEAWLRRGLPLARKMPGRLKLVVAMFAHGGLAVLNAIRKQRYDVLARRPKLSKVNFLGVGLRAFGTLMSRKRR
jgi:phytoene synthase